MKDEHIITIIEDTPLSGLSESALAEVRAHAEQCVDCRHAFEAAQISTLLLKERAAETFAPSPFFQTRVMAAWRERQAVREVSPLKRLWNATGALVSSMAATVAALVVLTFFVPGSQPLTNTPEATITSSSYTAEAVLLDESDLSADQMSYGQVLTTLYDSDDDR